MSERTARLVGLYTLIGAVAMTVTAPFLSLAYFATSEGAEELESGTVSGWADPAREHLEGFLTWAGADRVYSTYVQVFSLFFPAVFLCALAVRRRRLVATGGEKWGWRIALIGYGLASVGIGLGGLILIRGPITSDLLDGVFISLMIPGMLIAAIGSTVLGIALLRSPARFAPRAAAWLLTVAIPAMVVVPIVLGHNSLGMLPTIIGWGLVGARLWRGEAEPTLDRAVEQVAG